MDAELFRIKHLTMKYDLRSVLPVPALWLFSLTILVAASGMLAAQPVKGRYVEAELVSEMESVAPGGKFTVALRLKMDEHWHTYWRNPGDAGMATTIEWKLPEGFTADSIQWPYPETVGEAPELSYGYNGEVFLIVPMTAPANLQGKEVTLEAKAGWLVCNEVCIPGKADLTLKLPVSAEAPRPNSRWTAAFERTRTMLPREMPGYKVAAVDKGEKIELRIALREGANRTIPEGLTFFAAEEEVINHSADQTTRQDGDTTVIELQRSSFASAPAAQLRGVVHSATETWDRKNGVKALWIDVPIQAATQP